MIQNQSAGSGDVVSVLTGSGNAKGVITLDYPKKLTKQHHILSISISPSKQSSFVRARAFIAWVNGNMSSGLSGKGTLIDMVKYYYSIENVNLTIDHSAGTIAPSKEMFALYPFSIVVYGPPIN